MHLIVCKSFILVHYYKSFLYIYINFLQNEIYIFIYLNIVLLYNHIYKCTAEKDTIEFASMEDELFKFESAAGN